MMRTLPPWTLAAALTVISLAACGGDDEQAAPVDTTPVVGLYEIPISRNNQGAQPSDAARVEISPTEMRLNHEKILDLSGGRPPEGQVTDHVITPLRERLSSGAARSAAAVRVHGSVPYLTLAETLNTLHTAGLRRVHFAVRTVGESPQEGWMVLPNWRVTNEGENVEFSGRPLPWSAFAEQWRPVYDACRAGRYIDCDFPYENVAEGGDLRMELWTRGQGMKVTFRQVNAPEPGPAAGRRGGVALIEGVIAPQPAPEAEQAAPPATEGAFNVRHQEATQAESALSNLSQPVCGNQACQAVVLTDASAPSMRVLSMIGAVFANGFATPEIVFQIPAN